MHSPFTNYKYGSKNMKYSQTTPPKTKKKMDPTSSNLHQLWEQLLQATIPFNLISFSLIFLFFFFFLKLFFRGKNSNSLPPSPPKLPIIGNLHQLGTLPHRSLAALSEKYGPIMFLKLGQTPTLVISSSKLAREVMKSQDIIFCNRAQNTAANILVYGCHDIAFGSYGELWRQAKKICVLELLSAKRVDSFQHVIDEEAALLIKRIRKGSVGESVNLNKLLLATTNNIISRCVLGEKFEDENGDSKFGGATRKIMVLLTRFCVGDFFPGFGWIDVLRGFIGELENTFETLDAFFDKVIEEHRSDDHKSDEKEDFVDIMLKLQQNDTFDYRFTRDNFKAILLDMFVGGTDTTATSLEWTMAELMRNPTAMKKVQEEVRQTVGKKPKIEIKDTEKMKYMNCVIKESLRLHPPAPLLVPRETTRIVNLEGYQIPSKTNVWINAWAIQRDPKIWESPNEFIPERFMEENSFDFKGQDLEFIPFGSGRRKCPGISFGLASFEYALANLLYWFDWKLPEEMAGELDMSEEHGLTVHKKIPLHLKPIPFNSM